jgi:hypothetical protein
MDDEQAGVTVVRTYLSWHRSASDGRDHAVTDEEFARGRRANSAGRYQAVCGHVVVVGSMLEAPGARCLACQAYVVARSLHQADQRSPRRRHRKARAWPRLRRRPRAERPLAIASPNAEGWIAR